MKITITEFVTLDGVSQGPGSPTEDTSDGFARGGWLVPHLDEQFVRRASEWLDLADGLLLHGNPVRSVGALMSKPGRELQIHGSARLGGSLLAAGLVDTVRLVVALTIIGAGRRLFGHPSDGTGLRLLRHEVTSTGLVLLEYGTIGAPPVGEYDGVTAFV